VRAGDVAAINAVSPEYAAVMLWLPLVRVEVEKLATPFTRAPVPRAVVPSRKVTLPVAVPIAGATADTVAVKVTDWPKVDGFLLEANPTVVLP